MKNKILIAMIAIIGVVLMGSLVKQGANGVPVALQEKIYVAVEGSGDIAVLDARTKEVVKRINLTEERSGMTVRYMPHNVQVALDNKSVWVTANVDNASKKMSFQFIPRAYADTGHGDEGASTMGSSDEVIIIDPFSNTIVKRIELGQGLHLSHVSLTPDSKYAIVAAQEKGAIYKINMTSFTVDKEVATKKGAGPHGLRVSPDGTTAYIAMLGGKSLGILDIGSFNLKDVPLKGAAVQTGITPDGKYALASVYDAKSLAVYDTRSGTVRYVDLPKEAKGPAQLYPTPDSRFVYVADQGFYFDQPIGDMVYKIDLESMKVVQEIKGGTAPHGVALSRDGGSVFVTNLKSDDVSIIDTKTEKEVARVPVGKMPNGISVWYSQNTNGKTVVPNKRNDSQLVSQETSFDLGTVSMAKGKVGHSFTLKNSGNNPVKITKIYTSCMCTEATLVSGGIRKGTFGMPGHNGFATKVVETVQPGRSVTIDVSVNPAAHGPQGVGRAKKAVYIETDSATNPVVELKLDINVTP